MFDVYLIADAGVIGAERVPDAVERAFGGATWKGRVALQLRAKQQSASEVLRLAGALRELSRARGVMLLVHGHPDIAREVCADGVHLPEHGPTVAQVRTLLGEDALVGVSRHDAAGLARAELEGATFATLSPVFATPGKGVPLGVHGVRALLAGTTQALPVYALGGVREDAVVDLLHAGARGVAVIREVFQGPEPSARLTALCAAVASARREMLDTAERRG